MTAPQSFLDGRVALHAGDCREVLKTLADNSVDSVVTDPPYHLQSIVKRFGGRNAAPAQHGTDGAFKRASSGFMGKQWDGGDIAFQPELWIEVLRVMKPGGHLLAMGSPRNFHRLVCAIEDAGFEIRDGIPRFYDDDCVEGPLFYAYGSGFPKSHDIALDYEKTLCYQLITGGITKWYYHSDNTPMARDGYRHPDSIKWNGYGTALKPAHEPICLARKPISEASISANVQKWGTGAINVGSCRVPTDEFTIRSRNSAFGLLHEGRQKQGGLPGTSGNVDGRWPANLIHDGSEEVLACFPETAASPAGLITQGGDHFSIGSYEKTRGTKFQGHGDSGSAARFFYTAKADADDRLGSKHPTVKPLDLIQHLVRLITPPNGVCLDLFAGTGTTAEACFREGFMSVLIEREAEYIKDIERRMSLVMEGPVTRAHASTKARSRPADDGPLFGGVDATELPRHVGSDGVGQVAERTLAKLAGR